MKIKTEIPKTANIYSFISHLSQWNELTCIPQRKKEWLAKTGKLSNDEKKSLEKFCLIWQKSKFDLELFFLFNDQKKIWPNLTKKIGVKKTLEIKKIFEVFENKFNLIWQNGNKKLNILLKEFEKKDGMVQKKLEVIQKLCDLKNSQVPKKIKLKMLLSGNKKDCSGWSHGNTVILECSEWPIKKIDYLVNSIFLHECFHSFFQKNKKLFVETKAMAKNNDKLIRKIGLKNWPTTIIFQEALISSFLPEGYLTEKFLKIDVRKAAKQKLNNKNIDIFSKLRYFCALNLYPLAKQYVEQNKKLDHFYLEKTIVCLKDFILINKKSG